MIGLAQTVKHPALRNSVKFTFAGNVANVAGNWTILSGTGAYARLRGQATIIGIIGGNPEQFLFTFSGQVNAD